jgi:hypothetical protein
MKTMIASLVSLVFGLGLGWSIEHHRFQREKTEIVQQTVEGGETSDRERAVRAVRAIQSIESGDTQKAVQLLSTPIAHYYTLYTGPGTKEEKRPETRAVIEQLAKTNQIVAARIAELSSNLQVRTP